MRLLLLPLLLPALALARDLPGGDTLARLQELARDAGPAPLAFEWRNEEAAQERTALLQGLLLPGYNQARRGDWVRAGIFAGIEILAFAMRSSAQKEGENLDADFRAYADSNWDVIRYLTTRNARGEFAYEEDWNADPAVFENGSGSHVLPIAFQNGLGFEQYEWWLDEANWTLVRTQQYYEMIGKYAQYQRGWEDYGADTGWSVTYFSPMSQTYQDMRTASNDKLKEADAWVGLLMANHAVSFLETFMVRQRGQSRFDLGVRPIRTGEAAWVNTFKISWGL